VKKVEKGKKERQRKMEKEREREKMRERGSEGKMRGRYVVTKQ